jgi:hypothetical protein
MTEEEFKRRSFKHSQPLDYVNPRTNDRLECLLTAVNFDHGTFCLWVIPFDNETAYCEGYDFWVSYEHVFPPKHKLKKA